MAFWVIRSALRGMGVEDIEVIERWVKEEEKRGHTKGGNDLYVQYGAILSTEDYPPLDRETLKIVEEI